MLDRIKALLARAGLAAPSAAFSERDMAIAALLVEAAAADGDYGDDEHARVKALIQRRLGFDEVAADALLGAARRRQSEAVELFRFVDAARRDMDEEDRAGLVEMLWEVVYADGVLDPFEDRLIRSVAALLHVPDRVRAEARRRALERKDGGT